MVRAHEEDGAGRKNSDLVADTAHVRGLLLRVDPVGALHDEIGLMLARRLRNLGGPLAVRDDGLYVEAVLGNLSRPGVHLRVGLLPKLLVEVVHLARIFVLQRLDDVKQQDRRPVRIAQLTGL